MADSVNGGFTVKEILLDHVKTTDENFLKLETKLDIISLDHETRIRVLERSGSRLSGVWSTLTLAGAFVAGTAGLVIGVLAYVGG
jgi:hypothetical protein